MNIYLLSQRKPDGSLKNDNYDVFDMCVVYASSEEEARHTHPDSDEAYVWRDGKWFDEKGRPSSFADWVSPEDVTVTLVGTAINENPPSRVICASFLAG